MVEKTGPAGYAADVIITVFVFVAAFICIIPIWHVLMSSISDGFSLLSHKGLTILPVGKITLNGYKMIFSDSNVITGYLNTIFYVVATVGCGFLLNVVGGYALSRDTKLTKFFSFFLLITMLFNGGLIPAYMIFDMLHLTGSRWAIVLTEATMAVNILIGAAAFRSVPKETVESATIDGCGHTRLMLQIMFPQCKSLFMITVLNSFVGSWNSWLTASIYVAGDRSKWPIQLIINELVSANRNFLETQNPNYDRNLIQYAVIIAATLPIIVAFPFFQKQLEAGVIRGAVKE
ncbi:MAG: carbohydrate ABC transporter permease [Clostridiales bacterium]|jgi:putative aldouronate transport system permease protein|nr:carbohydrate ABC transporter permease [Clostridiales bacterium]MDR2749463.1 carbohydrate ABC transporter permease [Clostridiales bacterium]